MMTVGMLWFDDDRRRSLADKIRLAAQHYENKYGERPNICMLHPSTAGADGAEAIEGVRVQINKQVLPAHLWIGRAEDALGIRKPLEQAAERARIAQDGRKALMMNDWAIAQDGPRQEATQHTRRRIRGRASPMECCQQDP